MQSFISVIDTCYMIKDLATKLFIVFSCLRWTRLRAAGNTALVPAGLDNRAMNCSPLIGSGWGKTLKPGINTNNERLVVYSTAVGRMNINALPAPMLSR